MVLSTNVKSFLKFLLPTLLWCFIYRDLLLGKLNVSEDTFAVYAVVKYFLANLQVGIFAHWNPFLHWGMGHICQVGEYNPMWLLTYLFNAIGMDFYHAFLITVISYMFLGVIGVYYLLSFLLKDEFLAYLGFLFFLFSGYTMIVFTQMTVILLFVPAVWFFYFMGDFYIKKRSSSILCMTFCLMLIMTTYIPFYFLIVLICLTFFGLIFFPKVIWRIIVAIKDFIIKRPFLSLFAFGAVGIAVLISFLNWLFLRADFLVLARPTDVSYDKVKDSGILISDILRDNSLFSLIIQALRIPILAHAKSIFTLDTISFDNQRIFYLPMAAHVLLLIGLWSKINRRILLWASLSLVLFLIAITRLTGFYQFLYEHIFFFKMFRNLFILIPFISFFYILLILEVSKGAIQYCCKYFQKYISLLKMALFMMILYAPFFVLSSHAQKFAAMEQSDLIKMSISLPLEKPVFSFVRPVSISEGLKPNDVYRLYNWHIISMHDADRFITFNYGYPTNFSKQLASIYDRSPEFAEYVRHKFVLYDQRPRTPAFEHPEDFIQWFMAEPQGQMISSSNEGIKIDKFNANQLHITTHLVKDKFLVYNDSYHPLWKAYVNDKPVRLNKTHFAFKGIALPAGTARVRFEFEPVGGNTLYMVVLSFFYVLFFTCVYFSIVKRP